MTGKERGHITNQATIRLHHSILSWKAIIVIYRTPVSSGTWYVRGRIAYS